MEKYATSLEIVHKKLLGDEQQFQEGPGE
jgi:hypothetical protein